MRAGFSVPTHAPESDEARQGRGGMMAGDAEQLSMVVERQGGRVLVRLRGELDIATAPMLANALNNANSEFVVDLAELAFLDASGLDTLADASARAEQGGHHLAVINADSFTQRIFELTGLDHLLSGSDAL
jgi:anti-sigma B factor antagonist